MSVVRHECPELLELQERYVSDRAHRPSVRQVAVVDGEAFVESDECYKAAEGLVTVGTFTPVDCCPLCNEALGA